MTRIPIPQAKDRLSDYVAQAMAGEEVILTRHGKETVRLVPVEEDRKKRWTNAVQGWAALGRELEQTYGPAEAGTIEQWLKEDRRFD